VIFTLLALENDFQGHKMVDVDKYLIWLHKYKRNEKWNSIKNMGIWCDITCLTFCGRSMFSKTNQYITKKIKVFELFLEWGTSLQQGTHAT
jgi:hypothetical protein